MATLKGVYEAHQSAGPTSGRPPAKSVDPRATPTDASSWSDPAGFTHVNARAAANRRVALPFRAATPTSRLSPAYPAEEHRDP
jgi:hypothetical protein